MILLHAVEDLWSNWSCWFCHSVFVSTGSFCRVRLSFLVNTRVSYYAEKHLFVKKSGGKKQNHVLVWLEWKTCSSSGLHITVVKNKLFFKEVLGRTWLWFRVNKSCIHTLLLLFDITSYGAKHRPPTCAIFYTFIVIDKGPSTGCNVKYQAQPLAVRHPGLPNILWIECALVYAAQRMNTLEW